MPIMTSRISPKTHSIKKAPWYSVNDNDDAKSETKKNKKHTKKLAIQQNKKVVAAVVQK